VTDGQPVSFDLILAFPFVGVDGCPLDGVTVDMRTQALPLGAAEHSQADLPAFSTDSTDNWGAVAFIRPMSLGFVSSPARRIGRIPMRVSFFTAF